MSEQPMELTAVAKLERLVERLRVELEERTLVAQAAGMLMERDQLTMTRAFDLLDQQAREAGRDIVDVARQVIDRQPPGEPRPDAPLNP